MATALRMIKESVGILCGQRQGQELGAPQMYVQPSSPVIAAAFLKVGDFWIDTRVDKMNYWNGREWRRLG
jgi:hypothetical protein